MNAHSFIPIFRYRVYEKSYTGTDIQTAKKYKFSPISLYCNVLHGIAQRKWCVSQWFRSKQGYLLLASILAESGTIMSEKVRCELANRLSESHNFLVPDDVSRTRRITSIWALCRQGKMTFLTFIKKVSVYLFTTTLRFYLFTSIIKEEYSFYI